MCAAEPLESAARPDRAVSAAGPRVRRGAEDARLCAALRGLGRGADAAGVPALARLRAAVQAALRGAARRAAAAARAGAAAGRAAASCAPAANVTLSMTTFLYITYVL